MERKIGEVFDFEGKKLKVVETHTDTCYGCFFKDKCNRNIVNPVAGNCYCNGRTDKKQVVFALAEQTTDEEPRKLEELNLCEKLKYCTQGKEFWSPLLGKVKFWGTTESAVTVEDKAGNSWDINPDSTLTIGCVGGVTSEEPMLFPSREQRDWNKVKYERPVENLPKTWDEFVREMGFNPEKFTFERLHTEIWDCMLAGGDNINRLCDQHVAMVKLQALRDYYRQGWKPVYDETSYCIVSCKDGDITIHEYDQVGRFLTFQDMRTAKIFCERFRDIIKEAGDLI